MDLLQQAFQVVAEPFAAWLDVVDVLLVALVLYNLLLLIRGTREVQILIGILILVLFYYTARFFDLRALTATLQTFFAVLPLAIIVLFQHEIRRALAAFGSTPLLGWSSDQRKVVSTFNELTLAATTLAERRIGALIVIERLEGLRNYVENGIRLEAVVSLDLLISLFTPTTPTHDGAVIIQGERIAAAACYLPLTQNPELSKDLGTRHRAAIGISEETDALAVVVSEEKGEISVAYGGQIRRALESKDLRNELYKRLVTDLAAPQGVP
ncbi:MAG TPA: diadenylate cyclase CdaA [Thermoanaerobaculia bacterium]|jgi:diadenylate cyclase